MHRLVIALTSLLALTGAAVVAGYLFILGASSDRAATVVPPDAVGYASVYLTPSSGQQRNLGDLLTRLPGLTDQSALPGKLDELAQRLVGGAGIDYHRNVVPWLGDEIAVAVRSATAPVPLIVANVQDRAAADAAVARVVNDAGGTPVHETYQGVAVTTVRGTAGQGGAIAVVDDELLVSPDVATVHAGIDAALGRTSSLADSSGFREAMSRLPGDRVGSVYLDLGAAARAAGQASQARGFSTLSLALVIEPDGLRAVGYAPYDAGAAGGSAAAIIGLGNQTAQLTAWMPDTTEAELVVFGARQSFDSIVGQLGSAPGGEQIASSLAQLRALAALGLGIDLDRGLLPLFDNEAAVALTSVDPSGPHGQLLLRPSDPSVATTTLGRITEALRSRGAQVAQTTIAGQAVTSLTVPQVGTFAYAVQDGVVVAGLSAADVGAALEAHATGRTLAAASDYGTAFDRAGGHAGNEIFVAGARLADLLTGLVDLPGDARAMLTDLGGLAVAVPTRNDQIEIHAALTLR